MEHPISINTEVMIANTIQKGPLNYLIISNKEPVEKKEGFIDDLTKVRASNDSSIAPRLYLIDLRQRELLIKRD